MHHQLFAHDVSSLKFGYVAVQKFQANQEASFPICRRGHEYSFLPNKMQFLVGHEYNKYVMQGLYS